MNGKILISALVFGTLMTGAAFAGTHNSPVVKAKHAVVSVADKIQDKLADSGLKGKKVVTGKINKTFVQGHRRADGTHVDGHYRNLTNPISGPSLGDKAKKAAVKTGDCVQNKVVDGAMSAKKAVTGHQGKTFVKGHYRADGTHVHGHFRTM